MMASPAHASRLADLAPSVRADVLAAVRAVEEAEQPVPRTAFRALSDATLRAGVERVLGDSGRVLLRTPHGFLSGYADDVREALATDELGVLPTVDRAVLCLVLLHAVAIPRAKGVIAREAAWTVAEAVDPRTLSSSKLPDSLIKPAVRRLRDAGILAYGTQRWIVPGPQFARLTSAATEWIFEELVVLAEPEGLLAESIRRRRSARQRCSRPDSAVPMTLTPREDSDS
jgi:hypothetical protein